MTLAVIILTKNESVHLARCLTSVTRLANHIIVVDSFSIDSTKEISEKFGATFIQNEFVNHAEQFNFALTQLPLGVTWVLRIDADEYLSLQLVCSIRKVISSSSTFCGYTLKRKVWFCGKEIRYGGLFPVEIVRLFRLGYGVCEKRWMDEHIIVNGPVGSLQGDLIDHNLKSLTWWIQKHNLYSNREAFEVLKLKYGVTSKSNNLVGSVGFKRLIKERIYSKLPIVPKVVIYFLYRYVIRCGFLDGKNGFAFHFLQGFWYRYLVEIKIQEVEHYIRSNEADFERAISEVLGINI